MFTSKNHLSANMGIDPEIAAFFVDRKVPEHNEYWKERFLYVARGTGYLFIPLYYDIQFKCGLSKSVILAPDYVAFSESILHSAALLESNEINFEEHIANCKKLLEGRVQNQTLYNDLNHYFSSSEQHSYLYLGSPSKALNRGDSLLYQMCLIPDQDMVLRIIQNWYALVPSFLLMDDVMDLNSDIRNGEENSISDFGEGNTGIINALQYLSTNFEKLTAINPLLGDYFSRSLEKKKQTPYLKQLLNQA